VLLSGRYALKRVRCAARFLHEVRILQQLQPHEHVLLHEDACAVTHTLRFLRCSRDLMQALMASAELDAPRACRDVLAGLLHLRRAYLVHRDVKPENLLLCEGAVLLCDFGRALFAPVPLRAPFGGTLQYGAPEAIAGVCRLANDVWSAGVVFFCLVERLFPFDEEQQRTSVQLEFEADWPAPLRAAVDSMLVIDADQRAPVTDLRL
jgi:serine/threonine protein kinase